MDACGPNQTHTSSLSMTAERFKRNIGGRLYKDGVAKIANMWSRR